jgi:hypothetical protein
VSFYRYASMLAHSLIALEVIINGRPLLSAENIDKRVEAFVGVGMDSSVRF